MNASFITSRPGLEERNDLMVGGLTRDQGVAGLSLTKCILLFLEQDILSSA